MFCVAMKMDSQFRMMVLLSVLPFLSQSCRHWSLSYPSICYWRGWLSSAVIWIAGSFSSVTLLDPTWLLLTVLQVRTIQEYLPWSRQNLMFSATIPPCIEKMASEMMKNPLFISVGVVSRLHFTIRHTLRVWGASCTSIPCTWDMVDLCYLSLIDCDIEVSL